MFQYVRTFILMLGVDLWCFLAAGEGISNDPEKSVSPSIRYPRWQVSSDGVRMSWCQTQENALWEKVILKHHPRLDSAVSLR